MIHNKYDVPSPFYAACTERDSYWRDVLMHKARQVYHDLGGERLDLVIHGLELQYTNFCRGQEMLLKDPTAKLPVGNREGLRCSDQLMKANEKRLEKRDEAMVVAREWILEETGRNVGAHVWPSQRAEKPTRPADDEETEERIKASPAEQWGDPSAYDDAVLNRYRHMRPAQPAPEPMDDAAIEARMDEEKKRLEAREREMGATMDRVIKTGMADQYLAYLRSQIQHSEPEEVEAYKEFQVEMQRRIKAAAEAKAEQSAAGTPATK